MAYDLNRLTLHIQWVLDKPTLPGWMDTRNNIGAHTFYWIHEGKGTFTTDRDYEVEGGYLAYMKPGLRMSMRSDEAFPLQMTMVLFDCASVGYDVTWTGVAPLKALELPFLRKFGTEQAKRIGGQFRHIDKCWVPGGAGGAMRSKAALLELLHDLHTQQHSGEAKPDSAQQALELVKEQLETGYRTDIKIEELAKQYGISVSYLRKRFQLSLGMSPKAYHNHIRNEHACRYLMYSDLPIKEIAQICGYLEEYHFSKSFKKMNGLSPTGYRARYRPHPR
ncbi:AraC family transcriptional regulator [Paenibacillus sp. GD4]|uniref:helix-turn-helix domain-containing protein n=1 Tax=Paenibacillus sp. GD4 TaxID=3068890 RepID=UPI002796DB43|nr:AraC family transcriptional regulator [Paenibacillus sp. GD4]MDQ1909821.1 AraC family transcriptional regulator [Paenibacillus sp. GD4]